MDAAIVSSIVSSFGCFSSKFFSADENWKVEFLPQLIPTVDLSGACDVKSTLVSLNFRPTSMKFGTQQLVAYKSEFENEFKDQWKQLEIGEDASDKDSATIYCSGSVSSIDWAPTSGDLNFLAVASNNSNQGVDLSLTQTSKSCVQLYEFKNLTNDK